MITRTLAALLLSAFTCAGLAADYTIDPHHSFAYFEIDHLGLSKFRGRFDRTSGKLSFDVAKQHGSVEATIDTASISTGVAKLDEVLAGADFFDAAKNPTITFKSTEFGFADEDLIEVVGNLTMRGITKPVRLQVNSFDCTTHPATKKPVCGADLETLIKRSDFGMEKGLSERALGDDVAIRISVEANGK